MGFNEDHLTWALVGRCVLAGIGYAADSFDLFVINIVNHVLKDVYGETSHSKSMISSAALWGAIGGQLFFGGFADYLGRRTIFMCTLALTTLGAIASAFCHDNKHFDIYQQLAVCRFFLGFGVGGEYPLSATVTSESVTSRLKGRMMAAVFSMQGIGNLVACLLMYLLLYKEVRYDLAWRIGLGFGAVPGLLAFYFRYKMQETNDFKRVAETRTSHWENVSSALKVYWKPLLGTAGAWFLLDITFYGNGLFSGTVTSLMGLGSDPKSAALNALYVALMALPGYYLSVAFLDRVGRRRLQVVGFGTIACIYLIMAVAFEDLKTVGPLFLVMYGLTFLFSNFGPNATTYIIPGEFYPPEVRSSCHGISAASGKLGAAITAYVFPILLNHYKDAEGNDEHNHGIKTVLYLCAGVGFAGAIWTLLFVPRSAPEYPDSQEKREEYQALLTRSSLLGAINPH